MAELAQYLPALIIALLGTAGLSGVIGAFANARTMRAQVKAGVQKTALETAEQYVARALEEQGKVIQRLSDSNAELRNDIDRQDKIIESLQSVLGNTRAELSETRINLLEAEKRLARAEVEAASLRQESDELRHVITSLKTQEVVSDARIVQLTKEIERLQMRVQQLEEENKKLVDALESERRRRGELETQLATKACSGDDASQK